MTTTRAREIWMRRNDPVAFEVGGRPAPQPRPRFVGPGRRPVSTATATGKLWRHAVSLALRKLMQARPRPDWLDAGAGGVAVTMMFRFHTSKSAQWGMPHTGRPDADNLAKLVLDVMEAEGLLPGGDQRVADLTVLKTYTRDEAGVHVTLLPSLTARGERREATSREASPPPWLSKHAAEKKWRRNKLALKKLRTGKIEEEYPEVRDPVTGKVVVPLGWGAPLAVLGINLSKREGGPGAPVRKLTPEQIEAKIRERTSRLRARAAKQANRVIAEKRKRAELAAKPQGRRRKRTPEG